MGQGCRGAARGTHLIYWGLSHFGPGKRCQDEHHRQWSRGLGWAAGMGMPVGRVLLHGLLTPLGVLGSCSGQRSQWEQHQVCPIKT